MTDNDNNGSNGIVDIIHAGMIMQAQKQLDAYGLALIPPGSTIENLENEMPSPRRIKQRVTVYDVDSFDRYFQRFNTADTAAVFADIEAAEFVCVLDYHENGVAAAHGDHVLTLRLTETDEWKAWKFLDCVKRSQTALAEHIETHITDVAEPAGAELLERVRDIQGIRNVTFGSKVSLDNGDLHFTFSSETKGRGDAYLPERLTLGIAPFEGSDPYRVTARLRYRVTDEGELTLWYDLLDADDVRRDAVRDVLDEVRKVAGAERVFVGSIR